MAITPQLAKPFDANHPHEKEQFDEVYSIIKSYNEKNRNILGNGFLYGNINTNNNSELDALLMTTNFIIGLEFKNYGGEGRIVEITANNWRILKKDKTPEIDENGQELIVKGGAIGTPLQQASLNRKHLREDINKIFGNVPIHYIIIFNKEITIEKNEDLDLKGIWITCNKKLIDVLDELTKTIAPVATENQIEKYLTNLGLNIHATTYISPIETAKALCEKAQYQKQSNRLLYDEALKIAKKSNDEAARIIRIRCYLGKGEYHNAIKEITEAEQANIKEAYYYEAQMFEKGLSVSVNLQKAKELYQTAQQMGMSEAQNDISRIEQTEKENRAYAEKLELERKEKVKKAAIQSAIDTHDYSTSLLVRIVSLCALLYITGHFLSSLSVHWATYLTTGAYVLPCILCLIIALYENAIDPLADNLPWRDQYPPLLDNGNISRYTTVYREKAEMIFHKTLSLIQLVVSWAIIYGLLRWIASMDFIDYIDFKYFPTRSILLAVCQFYWKIACLLTGFWILQSIRRIDSSRDFGEPYIGGIKPGTALLMYWCKLGLYLLKPCIAIALFTVMPDLIIHTIKDRKQEATETVDKQTATAEENNQKISTGKNERKSTSQRKSDKVRNTASAVSSSKRSSSSQTGNTGTGQAAPATDRTSTQGTTSPGLQCVKVKFDTPIVFPYGLSRLTDSECTALLKFTSVLIENPEFDVAITGSVSQEERNNHLERLALQRATFIKEFLQSKGVRNSISTLVDDGTNQRSINIYLYVPQE